MMDGGMGAGVVSHAWYSDQMKYGCAGSEAIHLDSDATVEIISPMIFFFTISDVR